MSDAIQRPQSLSVAARLWRLFSPGDAGLAAETPRSGPHPSPSASNSKTPSSARAAVPKQVWRGRVIDQSSQEALLAEKAERARAEAELRRSEAELAAAQKIARIGSWSWDASSQSMSWSDENFRLHGFEPRSVVPSAALALEGVHAEDRKISEALFQAALTDGKSFSFEQRLILADGTERILHQRGEAVLDEEGALTKVVGTAQDITERKQAEEELDQAHQKLMVLSRQAGMAEVATGVLHNVGNVLNSVNVSTMVIAERLGKSRVAHLASVCELLDEHAHDLGDFLVNDPKGQKLPAFLSSLAERLAVEQRELMAEAEGLAKNIAHIKDIVAVQQSYAKVSGVIESLPAAELVADALEMNGAAFARHKVEVIQEFEEVPLVRVDKHKVLQILINVFRNAKYAVSECGRLDKQIRVRIAQADSEHVQVSIADNGVGIAPANLSRIFAHGFTTKSDGHGFGLHSAALAATEMGATLAARSEGVDHGATFTLTLPIDQSLPQPPR
jgi:PAS domain S-box-containing protein